MIHQNVGGSVLESRARITVQFAVPPVSIRQILSAVLAEVNHIQLSNSLLLQALEQDSTSCIQYSIVAVLRRLCEDIANVRQWHVANQVFYFEGRQRRRIYQARAGREVSFCFAGVCGMNRSARVSRLGLQCKRQMSPIPNKTCRAAQWTSTSPNPSQLTTV